MNRNPMKQEAVVQNLKDAGCPDDFVEKFLQAMECEGAAQQLRLLCVQRCKLLEQIHIDQKKLDCLDFLRYSLQKQVVKIPTARRSHKKCNKEGLL